MPMETDRLEVRETDAAEGIDVSLYGEDDPVEASTRIAHEEFGLEPADGREEPTPEVGELRTDATRTDVRFERDPAGFRLRAVGDGEDLVTARVDDEAWGLWATPDRRPRLRPVALERRERRVDPESGGELQTGWTSIFSVSAPYAVEGTAGFRRSPDEGPRSSARRSVGNP